MTGSALPLQRFTFTTFREFTPHLTGAERAAVFARLPEPMRAAAWADSPSVPEP